MSNIHRGMKEERIQNRGMVSKDQASCADAIYKDLIKYDRSLYEDLDVACHIEILDLKCKTWTGVIEMLTTIDGKIFAGLALTEKHDMGIDGTKWRGKYNFECAPGYGLVVPLECCRPDRKLAAKREEQRFPSTMVSFQDTVQSQVSTYKKSSAKFRFLWTISDYLKVKNSVKCPEYIEQKTEVNIIPQQLTCKLQLHPNGWSKSDGKHASIYMMNTVEKKGVSVCYEVSILDGKGRKKHSRSIDGSSLGAPNCFPVDFPADQRELLLPNGCLQILVEGTAWPDVKDHVQQSAQINKYHITSEIPLFDNEQHSDAALSVGDEKFHVYKSILSTKSSVFKQLFEESSQNIIVIPDVDPNVFRVVLYFIYNNMLTANAEKVLPDILAVAHKYKLLYLKEVIQTELVERITVDNSLDYLLVAEKCEASGLKQTVLKFISENRKDISAKHSQEVFKKLPQDLLAEAFSRLLNQD